MRIAFVEDGDVGGWHFLVMGGESWAGYGWKETLVAPPGGRDVSHWARRVFSYQAGVSIREV